MEQSRKNQKSSVMKRNSSSEIPKQLINFDEIKCVCCSELGERVSLSSIEKCEIDGVIESVTSKVTKSFGIKKYFVCCFKPKTKK